VLLTTVVVSTLSKQIIIFRAIWITVSVGIVILGILVVALTKKYAQGEADQVMERVQTRFGGNRETQLFAKQLWMLTTVFLIVTPLILASAIYFIVATFLIIDPQAPILNKILVASLPFSVLVFFSLMAYPLDAFRRVFRSYVLSREPDYKLTRL
jgi:hypothetical protein